MDLVHLVDLVVTREQRKERDNFEEDAANAPEVHLVAVVPISEQALGCAVPACRDVLCVRLLRVDTTTGAEVSQLHVVLHEEDVLRLDVTMEDAVAVHVVDRLQQLVHVVLDAVLRQVVSLALDGIVHVHVHQLEDER